MGTAGIRWDERGNPHSVMFNDQYFCRDNGYAEGIHVCCGGNSLRERFSGLEPGEEGTFTVIETGFGTGMDFCCVWELWDACAPVSWRLHFLSVELYPVLPGLMARALGLWPPLARYKDALLAQYGPVPGGTGDWKFDGGRVRLTVVFDDVVTGLRSMARHRLAPRGADAWSLDGFAPSKSPRMWSREVFAAMAPLSRPGTTVSTFTVAGAVRRGLEACGFSVRKSPGHGRKAQILTGVFKG